MAEFGAVEGPSEKALDFLKGMLAERRKADAKRVELRDTLSRPEVVLTCRVPSDSVEFAQLIKQAEAEDRKRDALPSGLVLACIALARYTEQVTVSGREMSTGDGAAFALPALQEALGVSSAWQAVRALYDDDFAVIRLSDQLMVEAGIGSKSVDVSDPTKGQ